MKMTTIMGSPDVIKELNKERDEDMRYYFFLFEVSKPY